MSNFMKNCEELKSNSNPPKNFSVMALQKSWKMLFISYQKLFLFSTFLIFWPCTKNGFMTKISSISKFMTLQTG